MPRASRQFAYHSAWHLTQRCHNKAFLLKFERDRHYWRMCLFEACRRYGLRVLNFIVTSNHVHVLVYSEDNDTVPNAIQYVSGQMAQHYNKRKGRRGAFWEDRYHAVPIKTREHLLECLVYIDLNMVRAGVVTHPSQWRICGFHDIQTPRQRYAVIDLDCLLRLSEIPSLAQFQREHRAWIDEKLASGRLERDPRWTEGPESRSARCLEAVFGGEIKV